jgi:uncharacterized protein
LLRVVAAGEKIVADPTARRPGRGAYLHPSLDCLERARRRRAIPRALRAARPLADGELASYLGGLASAALAPGVPGVTADDKGSGNLPTTQRREYEDKDERSMSKRR